MVTPEPSEASPLFSAFPVEQTSPRPSSLAELLSSDALSSLARTPLSLFQHLQRHLPPLSLRTVLYATIALVVITNVGRKPPVYLSRPGPAIDDVSPVTATGNSRTLSARVFSLNTFIRPLFVGVGDYKDERLADLHPVLQPYDIVCLQELFWTTGPRKSAFLNKISEHGLLYQASAPVPGLPGLFRFPPKFIDAGLVIVSRYPIVKAEYHTFSRAIYRSIDIIVSKGVLYARVSLFGDKPVRYAHVFTMHLQANNGMDDVPFDKVRALQMSEIADFVKQMTEDDPNGLVILAGDFNVDARSGYDDPSSSIEYKAAVEKLLSFRPETQLKDILYLANNESHPVTTAGGLKGTNQKNERLDYIFVSSARMEASDVPLVADAVPGSVRVEELRKYSPASDAPYDTLSDHYGVKAEILFTEPDG